MSIPVFQSIYQMVVFGDCPTMLTTPAGNYQQVFGSIGLLAAPVYQAPILTHTDVIIFYEAGDFLGYQAFNSYSYLATLRYRR